MPTYDFRCPQGHEFERFYRKISDAPTETPCPECGQTARRQLSAGAGLLFKGSGFYLTDYGKNAHRKSAPTGKSETKAPDSGTGETKSTPESAGEKTSSSETKKESTKPADSSSKKSSGTGEA